MVVDDMEPEQTAALACGPNDECPKSWMDDRKLRACSGSNGRDEAEDVVAVTVVWVGLDPVAKNQEQDIGCAYTPGAALPQVITPGGIRTPNLRLRRPLLYPVELQARCQRQPLQHSHYRNGGKDRQRCLARAILSAVTILRDCSAAAAPWLRFPANHSLPLLDTRAEWGNSSACPQLRLFVRRMKS